MQIDRYLVKSIATSFIATLAVLALIIVGNTFVRLLASASSGDLPADLLSHLLFYGSLKNLIRLVPVALLIGMMLAFSRLYRDSEMVAMRTSGVSPRLFYRAIFKLVLPLSVLMAFAVFFVMPLLEVRNQDLKKEVYERPEAAGIPEGQFVSSGNEQNNYTVLAEHIDASRTVMERFFIRLHEGDKDTLVWARSAILFIDSVNGERFLQIQDGYRYEDDPVHGDMSIVHFGEHGIRIPLRDAERAGSIEAFSTQALLSMNTLAAQAELQWRLSIVLSTPVLAVLAFPLSYSAPRQGRYSKIAVGILLYGLYANLLASLRSMVERGDLSPWIGLWWVHLLMIALSLWLLRYYYGRPR
ncbi:MAG: LPS export ABC transporter permease LptF [Proteobacteria bacterium]|nr:MAG: LPS export ABC transporter permease LptF [Pseudomonadota bacterium]